MINHLPPHTTSELEIILNHHLGHTFAACALAVIKDGNWVLDAVWGHIEEYPITEEALFDLASVTKLFTITAFLSLVSAGKIGLHDPLVKVIPEFGTAAPRGMDGGQDPHSKVHLPTPEGIANQTVDPAGVTFWHLLTHTSGLPAWRDVYNAAGPAPTPPDQPDPVPRAERWAKGLAALCGYPFVGQPGEKVVYSDVGLMLLGEATARLAGKPLETFIQERVLDSVGLQSARFNPIRDFQYAKAGIAPTEFDPTWRHRRVWGEVHDENACGLGGIAGHAGLFADARDVAHFGEAWLYEAEPKFGIDPELAADAQRQQAETDGARRGLGFALKAHQDAAAGDKFSARTFGHTGFTGTSLWIDPESELIVACLTNRVYPGREHEGIHPFRRALHDLLWTGLR